MAWRVAKSLLVLRDEINRAAPNRSKLSDGTIGDAAHASRASDHNPYIKDARGVGVVRALDITHDPAGGCDAHAIADRIRLLGRAGDPRVRYVISNARIASALRNWDWRAYSGSNPHRSHAHVSVVEDRNYDSTAPWGVATATTRSWFDMATKDELKDAIREVQREATYVMAVEGRQYLVDESLRLASWIRDTASLSKLAAMYGARDGSKVTRDELRSRYEVDDA